MANDALEAARRSQPNGAQIDSAGHCDWLADKCPLLHAMLTRATDKAGKLVPATVGLFFDLQDQRPKFLLRDRGMAKKAFGTLDDMSSPLEAIEDALETGKLEWRDDLPQSGKYQR